MDWAGSAILDAASPQEYTEVETYLTDETQRFPEIHGFMVYGPDQQPFISAIPGGQLCAVGYSVYIDDATSAYSYSNAVDCSTTGTRIMLVYRLL